MKTVFSIAAALVFSAPTLAASVTVYTPAGINSRGTIPNVLDVDAFQTTAPSSGFTMTGFKYGYFENFVPLSQPITNGSMTIRMWNYASGDPSIDTAAAPAGSFTFAVHTLHDEDYSSLPGFYLGSTRSFNIANPADYVTFNSNKVWFGCEFSHTDGKFLVQHATLMGSDPDEEVGTNLDDHYWSVLRQNGTWGHITNAEFWTYQSQNGAGDLYGAISMLVPEPASLVLSMAGMTLIVRRTRRA